MIAYTLKQDDDGQWSIRCQGSILASGLQLDSAIEQAYELAYTTRMVSGSPTSVEVITADANNHMAADAPPRLCRRVATA